MIPLDPQPIPAAVPAPQPSPGPPSLVAVLAARLVGYLVAWALVLGLAMAACNAMTADHGGPVYVEPSYALFDAPAPVLVAPARATKPRATPKPARTATPGPVAADPPLDCGGVDPADPEIDPSVDCATAP